MNLNRVCNTFYKTHISEETSQALTPLESQETNQPPTVFEIPELFQKILKKVPFEKRGKLRRVAKAWNAAIGEDPKLCKRNMNTLLTIMNDPATDRDLRIRAAEALGRIGDPASVEPLTVIMDAELAPPLLRCHAAEALAILLRRLNTSD